MDRIVLQDFDETRSRDAEPRHGSWPVLAQLPRIGGGAEPPDSRRSLARDASAPTSRSDDDGGARTKRYAIDPGHATIGTVRSEAGPTPQRQAEPAARHEGVGAEQKVAATRTRGTPRLRIDSAADHRPAAHARSPQPSAESPTFSEQMFRWHESLAPHRGPVGAALLAIAGGLLYWLAFSHSGMTIHPSELLRFSTDGSHETAQPVVMPDAAPTLPATSEEPAQAAGWTSPPRVANVEPIASETAAVASHADAASTLGSALAPPFEAPEPLPPVLDDLPTTIMLDRGVATPSAVVAEQANQFETAFIPPR